MNPPGRKSGLDRQLALARVGGDAELLKEIAAIFIEEYPKTIAELRLAIQAGDAGAVERAAHGLKGAVANFSAKPAVELALELENLGHSGQLQEAGGVLDRLEETLVALQSDLESL